MAAAWSIEPSPRGHGSHVQLGLQPCPSVVLFGRLCPGCGMTTSFAHMVRLGLVPAFRANAFGPLVFLAYSASALLMGYGFARSRRLALDSKRAEAWLLAFLLALLAYAAVRFWLAPAA